jgi:L-serine dehydratase
VHSLRNLYRIGVGPSSSHTLGPAAAAQRIRERQPTAVRWEVTLFGSLAATGRGHGTDRAIIAALAPQPVTFTWQPDIELPFHPNAMEFTALADGNRVLETWRVYSVGGGALREEGEADITPVYPLSTMAALLAWTVAKREPLWRYVEACEDDDIFTYLGTCWKAMCECARRGLMQDGELPGGLRLKRRSRALFERAGKIRAMRVAAYAIAIMEENAAGQEVVTAPTCGACGIVPAVLIQLQKDGMLTERTILEALATAGLVGNLVKHNASISGAEVGCQGEVGTACAMAAAAATQILGGTPQQIEHAAEMALEHHLGLTCDPILGLVQMPCIERNGFAATRALDCAELAMCSEGEHRISFDEVVVALRETGRDLHRKYRETGTGGLAVLRPDTVWLMGS